FNYNITCQTSRLTPLKPIMSDWVRKPANQNPVWRSGDGWNRFERVHLEVSPLNFQQPTSMASHFLCPIIAGDIFFLIFGQAGASRAEKVTRISGNYMPNTKS